MKKLIALLMALVLCLSLCACGKENAEIGKTDLPDNNEISPVEITLDNFEQYLSIDRTTDVTKFTFGLKVYNDTITVIPLEEGNYENVKLLVKLKITTSIDDPDRFEVEEYKEQEIQEQDNKYSYVYTMSPITLALDGTGEHGYTFRTSTILKYDYTYEIVGISGTYTAGDITK